MSESGLKPVTRTEAEVRDLVRAKIKAQDAYNALWLTNVSGLSEDEKIDLELRTIAARTELLAAIKAMNAAI